MAGDPAGWVRGKGALTCPEVDVVGERRKQPGIHVTGGRSRRLSTDVVEIVVNDALGYRAARHPRPCDLIGKSTVAALEIVQVRRRQVDRLRPPALPRPDPQEVVAQLQPLGAEDLVP